MQNEVLGDDDFNSWISPNLQDKQFHEIVVSSIGGTCAVKWCGVISSERTKYLYWIIAGLRRVNAIGT